MAHEVDDALLFAATVLHDIGLRHDARAPVRFEVDGADYAAEFLTARQVAAGDVDRVWEAIALHTSPGSRSGAVHWRIWYARGRHRLRRGADCVSDGLAAVIHEAYPRLAMTSSLVDEIGNSARKSRARSRTHRRRADPGTVNPTALTRWNRPPILALGRELTDRGAPRPFQRGKS